MTAYIIPVLRALSEVLTKLGEKENTQELLNTDCKSTNNITFMNSF